MVFEIENYVALRCAVEELCKFLSSENVPSERVFDSRLVAYELLGNVLKHSGGSARLQGELVNGYVELKIASEIPFIPPDKSSCADVYAEHGRGIYLVDRICEERTLTEDGGIFVRIRIN